MKVAYLAPFYPHVSHSFIRREIAALERLGVTVERFSLRPPHDLVDPADKAEAAKTTVVLAVGIWGLFAATLCAAITKPIRFFRALVETIQCGRRSHRGVLRHLVYLAEACLLVRLMRERDVEHLHVHFGTNVATTGLLARALGGPPFSFTAHGPEEFDRPADISLGLKLERAAFAIAISSFGRSQLYRWCGSEHWAKVHVVHCGVDASFRGTTPIPESPRMVCVGRLCEQKGQLLLIESVAQLDLPFELILAGDGPMRPQVEAAIRKHGIEANVRITGWLSGEQVRNEIQAARALVLPSFAEGLPVVLMESLGLGRPVVTTYIGGIPELVRDGIEGWLVPAGSVAELVDALRKLLRTSPAELETMGRSGAERVAERHDIDKEAAKLAAVLRATTAADSQPRAIA